MRMGRCKVVLGMGEAKAALWSPGQSPRGQSRVCEGGPFQTLLKVSLCAARQPAGM